MSVRTTLLLVVLVILIGSHESSPISDALQKLQDLFVKILGQSEQVLSFARFSQKYGKNYKNKEEIKHRFSVFQENLDFIGSTNQKGLPFKLGVNKFADLTNQEFLRNKFDCSRFGIFKGSHNLSATTPPTAKDWRDDGIVSPVKDQGQCEAGWAISAVGAVEAAYRKKYRIGVSLSEQQLLDCSTNNNGCDGGSAANAFQYIVERKLNYRSFYPSKGTQGKCRYEPSLVGVLIRSYGVGVGVSIDENKLKQWVGTIGPVTVGFHVTNSFAFYDSGVYTSTECGSTTKDLNHFMLVVGYGVEDGVPYWLVQNSWGADWGEKGYIKVEMGKNMCGVASYVSYPVMW